MVVMTITATLIFLEVIPSFIFWGMEWVIAMTITRDAKITTTFFWEGKGGGHDHIPFSSLGGSVIIPLLGQGNGWWL